MELLFRTYRAFFGYPCFKKLNHVLFRLSLHGLGILNFENEKVSGELNFLTNILPRFLPRRKQVFFDVGANIGSFCALLSKKFPDAVIHAFEPHPKNFARLVSNEFAPERVKCHNIGLGEERGILTLYDRADIDGSSHASLHESVISEIHKQSVVSTDVRIDTLESVADQENVEYIDFLKVDTEGHELAVLRGAARLLSENKIGCIQFEFNEMNVASRVFLRDFRKLLPRHELFRLLPSGMISLDDSPLRTELFGYQNVVAIPRALREQMV